ncbi:elongation factor 1-alpha 1-like [Saccostrea echinata]|uniref:elongation factor 1-alpha 1-like n=1 Tax=Saccostrea echinata TaxID=191078 RepID=UPI002A82E7E6|nr:elongation factor 1-alpha 1-like [Saccostrea echinata]
MMKSGSSAVVPTGMNSNAINNKARVKNFDAKANRKTRSSDGFQEIQFEACSSGRSRSPSVRTDNSIFPSRPPSASTEMSPRLPSSLANRSENKTPFLNLAMIGPVDSGKSSLTGRLLYNCGVVDEVTLTKSSNDATIAGKPSLKFAWLMDKLKVERDRNHSIDSKSRRMETSLYNMVVIDCPGHRNYIHNMITGISQSDVVVLVVPAPKKEFELSITKTGQLREYLNIAYSMGVKKLIVAVNKMDATSPPYSQIEYNSCIHLVQRVAQKVGYNPNKVIFVPVSAIKGDNITTPTTNMSWYDNWETLSRPGNHVTGVTLLDALHKAQQPTRMNSKALRVPIHTVYKLGTIGIVAAGRVHAGSVRPQMELSFAPSHRKCSARAIQIFGEVTNEGRAGDNVGIQFEGLTTNKVKRGYVCGNLYDDPPREAKQITAQIRILHHPGNIKKGYSPLLHCHTAMTACTITNIIERTDDRTGMTAEDFPTSLSTGNVGLVEMILLKPICVETFFDYPSLGRIILRDLKQTIAVGVVVKVTKSNIKDMKSLLKTQAEEKAADETEIDELKNKSEGYDSLMSLSNNMKNKDTIDCIHSNVKSECSLNTPASTDKVESVLESQEQGKSGTEDDITNGKHTLKLSIDVAGTMNDSGCMEEDV